MVQQMTLDLPMARTVSLVSLRMVREKTLTYRSDAVSRRSEVVDLVRPIFEGESREQVVVIGLDTGNRPTVLYIVGAGGTNQCACVPNTALKAVLLANATGLIVVHNPPGGTMSPSDADWQVTRRLADAAKLLDLTLLDHIIVDAFCEDSISMRDSARWPG